MASKSLSLAVSLACTLAPLLAAAPALANGKFPAADHIVVDPSNPAHIVTRTTFGLVTTIDGGDNWDWICEDGAGYTNFEPPFSIVAGGAMVLGYLDGLGVTGSATCNFTRYAGLAGQFVTDTSIDTKNPTTAVVSTAEGGANISKVWVSTDSGANWSQMGVDLPVNFLANTLDLAPSDPMRVYVTGIDSSTGVPKGRIARSTDGGASWVLFDILGSGAGTAPFLGAVDPQNPDRLYVRLDGAPGKLLVSTDGGATFQEIFTSAGFLKGFALSPDGSKVLAGGDNDGVWRASTTDYAFTQASGTKVLCLRWEPAGVYACADEDTDGFTIGLSADEGATFSALLHKPCIRDTLACDAASDVGSVCPGLWPALVTQLGIVDCSGQGAGGGGGTSSSTSTGEVGSGGATSTSGAGAGSSETGDDGGCSCEVTGDQEGSSGAALFGLALLTLGAAVRRKRG